MTEKFCIHCKHHLVTVLPAPKGRYHMPVTKDTSDGCIRAAKLGARSLVTGVSTGYDGVLNCASKRYLGDKGSCGEEGRFWEPEEDL